MNRSNINPLLILLLAFATIFRIEAQDIDNQHVSYPFTKKSLTTLQELLAIPNDAKYPNDIEKNVVWCEEQLAAAGFSTKRLETATVPLLAADYNKKRKKNHPYFSIFISTDSQ